MQKLIRIIGIDPGLRRTGWGVLQYDGFSLDFVAAGTVCVHEKRDFSVRLRQLYDGLYEAVTLHAPHEAAIEATFVNCDATSTLKLGQARGVAMLVPAICGLPVAEYAPNTIKKAVVGKGHAAKAQIAMMIKILIPDAVFKGNDAADALAVAICHAYSRKVLAYSLAEVRDLRSV